MHIRQKTKLIVITLLLSTLSMSCEELIRGVDGIALVASPIPVSYTANPATYLQNKFIVNNFPVIHNGKTVTTYAITPALPAGLHLNTTTGIIYGTPTVLATPTTYTITVTFSDASTADIPVVIDIAGNNRCS